jgi:putative FmdB family regulatory protein
MPIYEYECRQCSQRFERLQSFHDEPVRVCPNCGGETRRVLQPVGVIFKGSGWYITDSRKASGKTETDGGSSGSTSSSSSTTSKTETPATGTQSASKPAATDGGTGPKSGKSDGGTT